MIKDWNRNEVFGNTVFHFKNSLRPFITIEEAKGDYYFLDLNELVFYSFEDLEYEGLKFYTKEEDDDFMGVEVAGTIKDWF